MEIQELGLAIGRGIVKQLWDYLAIFLCILVVLNLLRGYFAWGVDDSDKSGWHRSGLRVHTDHKTGVQYVSDGKGGMMVRLESDGRPMVRR